MGARQGRGQHHSSKAMRRREGQNGSSADTSDGAGASTRSVIDISIVRSTNSELRSDYTVNNRYKPINPTTTITARNTFGDSRRP
ncbi:hypothetical protein GCM10009645_15690 [Mycolicibacterium poriferae]|uniref:Uncharacterized protein n=1 Tax=Mycolicibacterium poriferae TaxID=39694 RepID=A0A6N4VC60_9MYCO|nr:hypothetical protein MPOR_32370 [Mycolicibacterium poriferae]